MAVCRSEWRSSCPPSCKHCTTASPRATGATSRSTTSPAAADLTRSPKVRCRCLFVRRLLLAALPTRPSRRRSVRSPEKAASQNGGSRHDQTRRRAVPPPPPSSTPFGSLLSPCHPSPAPFCLDHHVCNLRECGVFRAQTSVAFSFASHDLGSDQEPDRRAVLVPLVEERHQFLVSFVEGHSPSVQDHEGGCTLWTKVLGHVVASWDVGCGMKRNTAQAFEVHWPEPMLRRCKRYPAMPPCRFRDAPPKKRVCLSRCEAELLALAEKPPPQPPIG
jgi:hypothetical protein